LLPRNLCPLQEKREATGSKLHSTGFTDVQKGGL